MLLGRRARYFGVERRAEEPAHVWQSELSRESIQRVLAVAQRFPLAKYWPEEAAEKQTDVGGEPQQEKDAAQLLAGI
jgi:hypothetical protein